MKVKHMLLPCVLLSGCAALPAATSALPVTLPPLGTPITSQILTGTLVTLSSANYRIVRADAIGSSEGFSLFGLFTLRQPEYSEAMAALSRAAGMTKGRPLALVNIVYQQSSSYFILFALPKLTVRADAIEFVDVNGHTARPTARATQPIGHPAAINALPPRTTP